MRSLRTLLVSMIVLVGALAIVAPAQAAWGVKHMDGKGDGLGGLGLGLGDLLEPSDAAVGPDGDIYVAVPTDCSVRVFAADGTPKRASGGCALSGLAMGNQLPNTIQWIAVDAKSRVYVGNSNMIAITDRDGTVLKTIGALGDPFYPQLVPSGLTVADATPSDPNGATSLYFGDGYRNRVARFEVAYEDNAVTFDWYAGGDVIAANVETGYEVCTVYADCQSGTADPNHMNNPTDIDIATPTGPIKVLSNYNAVVDVDPLTGARGNSVPSPSGTSLMAIAARSDGGFWVTPIGGERGVVWQLDSNGDLQSTIGTDGSPSPASNGLGVGSGLTSAQGGARVAIADYSMHRAGVYDSSGTNLRLVGKNGGIGWQRGTADGEFDLASDVTGDGAGGYWVLDQGNRRIVHFNAAGDFISSTSTTIGTPNPGQDAGPVGIGSTADGSKLYVTDSWRHRILEFTVASGVASFSQMAGYDVVTGGAVQYETCSVPANCKSGVSTTLTDGFSFPVDVEVQPGTGHVWVVEQSNNRVHQLSSSLANGPVVGGPTAGTANGAFSLPQTMTFEPSGDFWVGEYNTNRIQRFTAAGAFSKWIALACDTTPPPTNPLCGFGLAMTAGIAIVDGNLHVVENGRNRVAVYPLSAGTTTGWGTGNWIDEWLPPAAVYGAIGSNAGQFYKPRGIAAIGSDVVIADMLNSRVQRLGDVVGWNPGSISNVAPAETVKQFNKTSVVVTYDAVDSFGAALTCSPGSAAAVPLLNVYPLTNPVVISCDDPLSDTPILHQVNYERIDDLIGPTVVINTPVDGSTTTSSSTTFDFDATDDQDPDPPTCNLTSGSSVSLAAGANAITVNCTDWAGNVGSATVNVTYSPPSTEQPPTTTPPAAEPSATIKFAKLNFSKKKPFKGKISATVTCDRACPLELKLTVAVGRKKYVAMTKSSLASAGSKVLTVKFKKNAKKAIQSGYASKKKPKVTYTLSYGAKQGKSGSAQKAK